MATNEEEAGSDANPPAESFRLRVANLAWGTTDDAFKQFFGKYNPTEAVIIRRKQTGRSRGYGFVTFETKENMDGAIAELDGKAMDDREVKIAVSTSQGPYPEGSKRPVKDADGNEVETTSKRLIVQRLAWDVEDEQLQEAFSKYGEVETAKVIRNRRNGRSRGYGFVTFASEEDGKKALEAMDGNEELGFKKEATDDAPEETNGIRVVEARSAGPRPENEDGAVTEKKRRRRPKKTEGDDNEDGDDDTRPGPRRVFVGDLKEETSEETVKAAFEQYGAIKDVRLILDRETNKSRGFAYVTFEEHDDFQKAIAAFEDGGQIDDQDVKVTRAFPSRQGGRGRGRGRGRRRRRTGGRGGGGGRGGSEGPTDL